MNWSFFKSIIINWYIYICVHLLWVFSSAGKYSVSRWEVKHWLQKKTNDIFWMQKKTKLLEDSKILQNWKSKSTTNKTTRNIHLTFFRLLVFRNRFFRQPFCLTNNQPVSEVVRAKRNGMKQQNRNIEIENVIRAVFWCFAHSLCTWDNKEKTNHTEANRYEDDEDDETQYTEKGTANKLQKFQ